MSDLVERLREQTPEASGKSMYWGRLMKESADEIERLRIELNATQDNEQRLVDANKPLLTRACAAEKEIKRLRAVLEQIRDLRPGYRFPDARDIAREALL